MRPARPTLSSRVLFLHFSLELGMFVLEKADVFIFIQKVKRPSIKVLAMF